MVIIWHDNAVAGQYGCTEYTNEEVAAEGGIDAIMRKYADCGIFVYRLDFEKAVKR